jgi:cytochrome c553
MKRISLRSSIGLLTLLPAAVLAVATARQEYLAVVRSKPNLEHGAELFRNCAVCHGPSGTGTEDGNVPRIAGQHFRVLAKQLVDYRHHKRWDIRMEHFTDRHLVPDAQTIADIAAYVSQLDAQTPPGVGKGDLVGHGATLYAAHCQSCHGDVGQGDARTLVPRLAGQHYEYLLRQMYDAVDGRRPNFPSDHIRLLAGLERADLLGVSDFLSRSAWTDPAPLPHRSR